MKKTVIKRRKRVPAATQAAAMQAQQAAQQHQQAIKNEGPVRLASIFVASILS